MSLPKFSEQANVAKAKLYTPYNDITIFVEDISLEHLYLKIFKRLMKDNIRIRRVFPLNGKRNLLKTLKNFREGKTHIPKPSLFLADKDLDPFLDIEIYNDPILVYLKSYCIENYLIEEKAVIESLQWKLGKVSEEIKDVIMFNKWKNEVREDFTFLFTAFIVIRKFSLGKNVSLGPYFFMENNGYNIDDDKVKNYLIEKKQRFVEAGHGTEQEFDDELIKMRKKVNQMVILPEQDLISGKYLFASLIRYSKNICCKNIDEDFFLGHLVANFNIEELRFIETEGIAKIS